MSAPIHFIPYENLIYLLGRIYGPRGSRIVYMALDTGATTTMVSTEIIVALGYSVTPENKIRLIFGGGLEDAPEVQVQKMSVANHLIENLKVTCYDLPQESGLDGLLGLNFLRNFDMQLKFSDGTLTLEPILEK